MGKKKRINWAEVAIQPLTGILIGIEVLIIDRMWK